MKVLAVRPMADSAVTIELADEPGAEAARRVRTAMGAVEHALDAGELEGCEEVASAFCSLTVHYDPLAVSQTDLVARLVGLLDPLEPEAQALGRLWHLPCCYDDVAGIDLPDLSAHLGLPEGEIVSRHAGTTFTVHALGFLPGLPFLGGLPAELARPRRREPRTHVPAGSVAIANRMCVIYPWVSPGGWHIVGACPVPLFDIGRAEPALLSIGDRVSFVPVARTRHEEIREMADARRLDLSAFRVED